jgi:hypothetical protein
MASGKDPVTRPNGGSERSHQIEAEIDQTRAAMDRTVDLIAGKLTPQQLAVEAMSVFKDGSSALATKVIQTAREHPLPAAIIGLGIGLLITESKKGSSSERGFEGDRGFDRGYDRGYGYDRQVGFGSAPGRYETGRYETGRYATAGFDSTGYETGGPRPGGEGRVAGAMHKVEGVAGSVAGSVSSAAGSVADSVKSTATGVKDTVAGVKDTVALSAMEAKDRVGETASHVREQAGHVTEQVREQAGHIREQVADRAGAVRETAEQLRERMSEGAGRVREQAARVPMQARQQWHDAKLGFWQTMDQRPFAIGIAALAAGVAAGLSVPASRKEQELMGETRDRLLDQAKGYTREAVDMGKQVARVAADTVKSEVERQGLTPATIADKVRTIGREAEQALKSEAERVAPEPLRAMGTPTGGGAGTNVGGAAGRGMSAGFASTQTETRDTDATVPGTTGTTGTKNRT